MRGLYQAVEKINRAKSIAICCHINPDGDCIGSLLALGLGLEHIGKKVYMLSPEGVPKKYRSLPGADRIEQGTGRRTDLAIAVDCGTKEMLGRLNTVFETAKDSLEIDHHEFRRSFAHAGFIDIKAAAVGEMIYVLLTRLNVNITQDIARNILTSVIVETNSFRLPAVGPFTFTVCAKLMKTGLDFHIVSELIYWSRTNAAARMLGICLSRSRLLHNGKIVWSIVRMTDLRKFNARQEDVDAAAGELLTITGVEAAVFFREQNKKLLRVSLRSKGRINVASIAEKYDGGGHFDAAGCRIPNRRSAREGLLNLIKQRIHTM